MLMPACCCVRGGEALHLMESGECSWQKERDGQGRGGEEGGGQCGGRFWARTKKRRAAYRPRLWRGPDAAEGEGRVEAGPGRTGHKQTAAD